MAKDKKKKAKKKDKSGTSRLKALAQNPLVADVVTAALVATAAALKDSKKARQLAAQAGDEIGELARDGADRGAALWQMAMEVGRRSLAELAGEAAPKRRKAKPAAAKKSAPARKSGTAKKTGAAKKTGRPRKAGAAGKSAS